MAFRALRRTAAEIDEQAGTEPDHAASRRRFLTRAAAATYEQLGTPEGELALVEATLYLALAPKSNAAYLAFGAAQAAAREHGSLPPPLHIRNAPTRLMKRLGYGQDYSYDHDAPDRFSGQDYFPEGMARQRFYAPTGEGFERELAERTARLDGLRRQRSGQDEA